MRNFVLGFVVFCCLLGGGQGFLTTVLPPLAEVGAKSSAMSLPDTYLGSFEGLLLTSEDIRLKTKEIAAELKTIYVGGGDRGDRGDSDSYLCLVCVLKGAFPFFSMLCDELALASVPFEVDFIRAKR